MKALYPLLQQLPTVLPNVAVYALSLGVIILSGCGSLSHDSDVFGMGSGWLYDGKVTSMYVEEAGRSGRAYVDVFKERSTGRAYYFHDGIKVYLHESPRESTTGRPHPW